MKGRPGGEVSTAALEEGGSPSFPEMLADGAGGSFQAVRTAAESRVSSPPPHRRLLVTGAAACPVAILLQCLLKKSLELYY